MLFIDRWIGVLTNVNGIAEGRIVEAGLVLCSDNRLAGEIICLDTQGRLSAMTCMPKHVEVCGIASALILAGCIIIPPKWFCPNYPLKNTYLIAGFYLHTHSGCEALSCNAENNASLLSLSTDGGPSANVAPWLDDYWNDSNVFILSQRLQRSFLRFNKIIRTKSSGLLCVRKHYSCWLISSLTAKM